MLLASLVAQTVKNLPAIQETWIQSLGWEDPPEKEMASHSNILGWEIPWSLVGCTPWSLVGCTPWGRKRVRHI